MVSSDDTMFLGSGEGMVAAVRAFDWSSNPLGPIHTWPAALKTAVGLALSSGFPKAVICGPELITIYNDAFAPILGDKPDCLGRSFRDIWSEVWHLIGPLQERAYDGHSTFIEDYPLVINRRGYPEQAYFTFAYTPIRDEVGHIVGMMDTVIETTARVETERNIKLINAELGHRIKNTLAIVLGIARQTFQVSASASDAEEALNQRLMALSAAHSTLNRLSWTSAPIVRVIEGALAPYSAQAERIRLEGPPVDLSAKQSLSLSLAINELAANALKYGALSNDEGHILLRWNAGRPGTDDEFRLVWEEVAGPIVQSSGRVGFGTKLVRAVGMEFGGDSRMEMRPEGVRFELATTMRRIHVDDQGEG